MQVLAGTGDFGAAPERHRVGILPQHLHVHAGDVVTAGALDHGPAQANRVGRLALRAQRELGHEIRVFLDLELHRGGDAVTGDPVVAGEARAVRHLLAVLAIRPVHPARFQVDVAILHRDGLREAAALLEIDPLHATHRVVGVDALVAALDREGGDLGLALAHAGTAAPVLGDLDGHVRDLAGRRAAFGRFARVDRDQGQRLSELESARDLVGRLDAWLEAVVQGDVQVLPGHAASARGRIRRLAGVGAAHAAGHEAAEAPHHPAHVRHPGHVVGEHVDVEVGRRVLALLAGGGQGDEGGGEGEVQGVAALHGGSGRRVDTHCKAENRPGSGHAAAIRGSTTPFPCARPGAFPGSGCSARPGRNRHRRGCAAAAARWS